MVYTKICKGLNMIYWTRNAYPANTNHLYDICTTSAQGLRRWPTIVPILYKCFVYCWVTWPRNTYKYSASYMYLINVEPGDVNERLICRF